MGSGALPHARSGRDLDKVGPIGYHGTMRIRAWPSFPALLQAAAPDAGRTAAAAAQAAQEGCEPVSTIEERVARAAAEALRAQGYVAPVDVLIRLGWLAPTHRDHWQQGRIRDLEQLLQVKPSKVSTALQAFEGWARAQGLRPSETAYLARTRDQRPLQFSSGGDPAVERTYRTHWLSPELSQAQQTGLQERASRPPDLVVIAPLKDWTCAGCGGTGSLLLMEDDAPLCLACADLDHLVYLPRGDATLTRRARKGSRLAAVVVRFSRSRKRYERQGILVEEEALREAEASCLADADARARRREREAGRRASADESLVLKLAAEVLRAYPGCPPERAEAIAAHTAVRGSGRVGRSAAGRRLDPEAVELAVRASVRHRETRYDELLMAGVPRAEARARVRGEVAEVLERWRG